MTISKGVETEYMLGFVHFSHKNLGMETTKILLATPPGECAHVCTGGCLTTLTFTQGKESANERDKKWGEQENCHNHNPILMNGRVNYKKKWGITTRWWLGRLYNKRTSMQYSRLLHSLSTSFLPIVTVKQCEWRNGALACTTEREHLLNTSTFPPHTVT